MRLSTEIISVNDIKEESILEIGTKSEIISIISEVCSEFYFHDGYYYLPNCSVENPSYFCWKVYLGNDDPVKIIFISPHTDQCDLTIIKNISQRLKCHLFDPQNNEFILAE
jgi:hypothetical protein